MRYKALQPDNPILHAEINHYRRTIPRWLQWFDRFGVVVMALVVSLVMLYSPVIIDLYGTALSASSPVNFGLVVVLWGAQLLVILRCLFAGYTSIGQHHGQQWDVLALTSLSPRQVFTGKWWSVVYQLRGWLLAFGLIKLAVFAVLTINLIIFCYRNPLDLIIQNVDYYSHGPRPFLESALLQLPTEFRALPSVERIMVTGIHTVAIALLEVMASAAIGIVGGLIPQKVIGLASLFLLRFAPIVGFTLFPMYGYSNEALPWRWYEYTWFSFADGGSTAILRAGLVAHGTAIGDKIIPSMLLAFYAAIILYLAYLLFAFVVSHILLRRQGLLPASSK